MDQTTLFEEPAGSRPLADRLRPRDLEEYDFLEAARRR